MVARRWLRWLSLVCAALAAALAAGAAPALAAGPPVVDRESLTGVAQTAATLTAQINPEESATSYRFEYGTTTAYGTSVPVPDAAIGSGSQDVAVSQVISGLQAGTAYHYRVVASNEAGSVAGRDRVLRTYAQEASGPDTCANAEIRQIQSAQYLPDCRAYEMVSPTYKNGANIAADGNTAQSARSGDAIKYYSTAAFGDAIGIGGRGAEYLSQRTGEGWITHSINPEQSGATIRIFIPSEYQGLSEDLTKGVYYARSPVLAGYPNVEHVSNLYLRTDLFSAPPGSYELLSDSSSMQRQELLSFFGNFVAFAGTSADWRHIVFETVYNLTPDAPPQPEECVKEEVFASGLCKPRVYEWLEGRLRLVGIMPNGEAAPAAIAGAGAGGNESGNKGTFTQAAVSADGSRVVFETGPFLEITGGSPGGQEAGSGLYMRIDGTQTIKLNVSERSEPDPNGEQPVTFQTATADDSKVFFTTSQALTGDAIVDPNATKLYMYDMNAPAGKHLTLISVDSERAAYRSGLSLGKMVDGISANGEYVYFETQQQLTPEQPPVEYNGEGHIPFNTALVVWHDGVIRYITQHKTIHDPVWNSEFGRSIPPSFRVSPDGRTVAFVSGDPALAERAGYEDPPVPSYEPNGYSVVYVYSYDSQRIACASCSPSGALPESNAGFTANDNFDGFDIYQATENDYPNYETRALSEDGRYVFFDTADALVPQDTNGLRDVYEYDTHTGRVHLISGGTCGCVSTFVDASPDSSNVFFVTHQPLVRADGDTNGDVYDARVGGGLMSQNVAPAGPCEGDDCQGPAKAAPVFSLPASSTFEGAENARPPAAKGVKAKRRGVRKHRRKHRNRRRRHGNGRHGRRTGLSGRHSRKTTRIGG